MTQILHEIFSDWDADEGSNFIGWSHATRMMLQRIVREGPALLGKVVDQATRTPDLRIRFETHQLLDYLVLFDCPVRGLRLRLHVSTSDHLQRVHDHRFSFSSAILNGIYEHSYYAPCSDIYAVSHRDHALHHQDRAHPDPLFEGRETSALFALRLVRNERAGDCYTMHHSVCHTVLTTRNTVSLVLRGRAQKERSFIFDRDSRQLWWRFGREHETESRVASKIMSDRHLDGLRQTLAGVGVL